ncbi:class I adenylate-forming enzyme family protein [Novosphingobium malaysiense]|uniref:AMP-dependent synthetase n=1 Tax=Novosphingobium malaysiense TaxID=1348853 RepID=A0A0B1ZMC2_9SPHN|nr:class I adenylate-forming enzyme family protein [Novosphingobium malaysiense]KHK90420.1 hypothetical protein LK12_17760 [Novosphingobium malaysiense]
MKSLPRPVDPGFVPTVPNLIAHASAGFADRPFLIDNERTISHAGAERASAAIARGLLALGACKASRVALLVHNCIEWVLCWQGAARMGALTQPFSTLYKPAEIAHALDHNDTEILFLASQYAGTNFIERIEAAIPGLAAQNGTTLHLSSHPYLRHIIVLGDCDRPWAIKGLDGLQAVGDAASNISDEFLAQVEKRVTPADLAVTISTSGTTAYPKSVVHTHGTTVRVPHEFLDYIDFLPDDRNLVNMPLFWVGGFNGNLIPALHSGAALVFARGPGMADMIDAIERHRVTRMPGWVTQREELVRTAAAAGADLSSIRGRLDAFVDEHGKVIPVPLRGGNFGMTETFGMHTIERRRNAIPRSKAGAMGRQLPGIQRRIVDLDTGAELGARQQGELQVRGYSMMSGYYKVEREDCFLAGGWFATGDVCSIDEDGYLYYHTRSTEMIKTAGANVAPLEVERVLKTGEGVIEAYVFGLPHPKRGDAVTAVVVGKPQTTLDTAVLLQLTKDQLSSYKVPLAIIQMEREDIPRTAAGKVNKNALANAVSGMIDW